MVRIRFLVVALASALLAGGMVQANAAAATPAPSVQHVTAPAAARPGMCKTPCVTLNMTAPKWVKTLEPYIYVSNYHYKNHPLSAAALKVVTSARLATLKKFWAKYHVPWYKAPSIKALGVRANLRYSSKDGYVESHWWGGKIWVNGKYANLIADGAVGVSIIVGVLGAKSWGLPGVYMAASLAAVGTGLKICQDLSSDNSLTIYTIGAWPPMPGYTLAWTCKLWP